MMNNSMNKYSTTPDNDIADIAMTELSRLRTDVSKAIRRVDYLEGQLARLRESAHRSGGVRWQRDRVQASSRYDISDTICSIVDCENEIEAAKTERMITECALRTVLRWAGFPAAAEELWLLKAKEPGRYYNKGLAARTGMTIRQVEYWFEPKVEARACRALYPIISDPDITIMDPEIIFPDVRKEA